LNPGKINNLVKSKNDALAYHRANAFKLLRLDGNKMRAGEHREFYKRKSLKAWLCA
jgi:hypothetical protein